MGCGEQQTKRTSKKTGTHHMFYCIMAKGRIEIPTTPKTDLPMTIYTCFLPINIITKRSILDTAENLNPPTPSPDDSNAKQCHHHIVGSRSTSEKSFSRSLVYIIDRGCEASCILIFTVPFDT